MHVCSVIFVVCVTIFTGALASSRCPNEDEKYQTSNSEGGQPRALTSETQAEKAQESRVEARPQKRVKREAPPSPGLLSLLSPQPTGEAPPGNPNKIEFQIAPFLELLRKKHAKPLEQEQLEQLPSHTLAFTYPAIDRFPKGQLLEQPHALCSLPSELWSYIVSLIEDRPALVQYILLSRVSKGYYQAMGEVIRRSYPKKEVEEALRQLAVHLYSCSIDPQRDPARLSRLGEISKALRQDEPHPFPPLARVYHFLKDMDAGFQLMLYYNTYAKLLDTPLFLSPTREAINPLASKFLSMFWKHCFRLSRLSNFREFQPELILDSFGPRVVNTDNGLASVTFPLYFAPEILRRLEVPELWLVGCELMTFPISLSSQGFSQLKMLTLRNNQLKHLYLKSLPALEVLNAEYNELVHVTLPPKITQAHLRQNGLQEINLSKCPNLTYLDCSHNPLKSMVPGANLQDLIVPHCAFKVFYKQKWPALQKLVISNNRLQKLVFDELEGLKVLEAQNNPLQEVGLLNQSVGSLEYVNFSNTQLKDLPFPFLRSPTLQLVALASQGFSWSALEWARPWFLGLRAPGQAAILSGLMVSAEAAENPFFRKFVGQSSQIGSITFLFPQATLCQDATQAVQSFRVRVNEWRKHFMVEPLTATELRQGMWERMVDPTNSWVFGKNVYTNNGAAQENYLRALQLHAPRK